MTPPGPWRLIAKRTVAVWPLVVAAFGAVLLAAALLAAGPMYAGAAAQAGLERKLADADVTDAGLDVTSRASPTSYADASAEVEAALRSTLPAGAPVYRVAESDSVAADDGRRFVLAFVDDVESLTALRDGRHPRDDGELEAAISTAAAETTGLGVGDVVRLPGERSVEGAAVRIVGTYEVAEPEAAVWWNDELMLDGVRGRDVPTYGPLLVTESALLETVDGFRASWRTRPDGAAFDVGRLDRAAASIESLEERLGANVPRGVAAPVVSTGLPTLLEESDRELGVARSGVLVPLAQLALLAAYGLVFVAALIRRRRRREDELLLTRGAKPRSLAVASAVEAVALAAVAALAAPWVAALAIELVSAAGPLASARLDLEPEVGALPYALALAGAAACLVALVLPALRHERGDGEEARAGFFARTGLDIALLVAAGVALWQLRSEGAPVVAGEGDLDLLLVAVPAVGILAGAVLAGRLLPPALALLARLGAARRGVVPALAARRLARTAVEHRPAAVLLVAALAIGTFAAAYARTWDATQDERAALLVGADIRVPDDRRSDAYPPAGRARALAATRGVAVASPVGVQSLRIGGETLRLVAVDAARTPVAPVGDTAARQAALLRELARRRTEGAWPELSGRTIRIAARTALEPLPEGVTPPTIVRFGVPRRANVDPQPQLTVVVRDADGLLHRLPAGALPSDGRATPTVQLDRAARLPLQLLGLELSYRVPGFISRSLEVELDSPLLGDVPWHAETTPFADPLQPAQATVTSGAGLTFELETGSSESDVGSSTVVLLPEPPPEQPLPVIAGTDLLDALGAQVGNVVELDTAGGTRRVEIVGALTNFATVAEGGRFLVADLPTLFAARYADAQEVVRPDFWLLELEGDRPAPTLAALARPPLAVEGATAREQLATTLTNDPLAVATSGALWLGFFAAALFAVAAFAVAGAARSRKHLADASLLGGLGLERRGTRALLVLEDAALALLAAAIGVALGAALALLVLPAVAFTETGDAAVPRPQVDVPWGTVAVLAAAVIGAILLAALARAYGATRASIAAELRSPAR